MRYSTLTEVRASRDMIDAFGGYNHNVKINSNEFYDMKNMTSDHYPVLSPRNKRGVHEYPTLGTHSCNGIIAKDKLCYVDGTMLYVDNVALAFFPLEDSRKQLISMGSYLLIFPDKKYININNMADNGDMEAHFTSHSTVTFEMCKADGTSYDEAIVSSVEPQNPSNMDLWIDTSSDIHTLKQYSKSSCMWTGIATTYVKIKTPNIASQFNKYDGVKISGITHPQLESLNDQISLLWNVHKDEENNGADDYIIVIGLIDTVSRQFTSIHVDRNIPDMDFVVESENRLWGCKYGFNSDNKMLNEIYACKLGDFKNWNCFMGISTDSYVASCGTDGNFTGAITHLGHPIFFKENCLHKIYGNFPANYQIQTTACRGVMKGCGDSLAIVNEKLFYKTRNGVAVYDGSLPVEISEVFGDVKYTALDETSANPLRCGAVAGSHRSKYYIDMKSEADNKWYLFVYDADKNMWHKEDQVRINEFCSFMGELYYVDHKDKLIHTIMGSGTLDKDEVQWMVETGILGTDMPDKKYISKLLIRMSMDINARAMFYIQHDSMGDWEHIATITGTTTRTFVLPIRPKRCDHFRLRIEGTGDVKIMSMTKNIEQGAE